MDTVIFLLILSAIIWFWQDSMHTKEIAISYARKCCQSMHYQFLDETVAMKTLKPGRNLSGNFSFHRHYYFEFSLNGHDRFNGSAFLIGQKLESIQLNHPDGIIIQDTQN